MRNKILTTLAIFSLMSANVLAANTLPEGASMGPVVKDFGPHVKVPDDSFKLSQDGHFKALMDIADSPEAKADLNRYIESAARFLNMNASSGIAADNMELALVVHGGAVKDLFTDAAYQAKFEQPNPNTALLDELSSAGVKIYVCGQSMGLHGYSMSQLNPAVQMAISAMSASVQLQSDGYVIIP